VKHPGVNHDHQLMRKQKYNYIKSRGKTSC